jgi:hypothetical protein
MDVKVELDPSTAHPLVKHAWEQAVRLRLHELDFSPGDDPARLRAKRRSLDLLHCAITAGGAIDIVQLRLLLHLLGHYAETVREQQMPVWPGGQYAFLARQLEEEQAVELAASYLNERAAAPA